MMLSVSHKVIGYTFRGENSVQPILPSSEKGLYSKREEFAPTG